MKYCPYCGYANEDTRDDCVKCSTSLVQREEPKIKVYRFGPLKAHDIRKKALGYFVLGLMVKIYWGGYGTWTPFDTDLLASLRAWIQPVLLYGGALVYAVGWILNWV